MSRIQKGMVVLDTTLLMVAFVVAGCVDPKLDTRVNADIDAKMAENIRASVQAGLLTVASDVEASLDASVRQQFGSFKGTQNTGAFSGGAVYVMIICLVFMALAFVLAVIKTKAEAKWRQMFSVYATAIATNRQGSKDKDIGRPDTLEQTIRASLAAQNLLVANDKELAKKGLN